MDNFLLNSFLCLLLKYVKFTVQCRIYYFISFYYDTCCCNNAWGRYCTLLSCFYFSYSKLLVQKTTEHKAHKKIHGDLKIRQSFVVPEYPEETHGLKLGLFATQVIILNTENNCERLGLITIQ